MNDPSNSYDIARSAIKEKDIATAYKYYKEIFDNNPSEWEANFYTVYCEAMMAKKKDFWSASISVMNIEKKIFTAIRDCIKEEEKDIAIKSVCEGFTEVSNKFTDDTNKNFAHLSHSIREEFIYDYVSTLSVSAEVMYTCGEELISTFGDRYSSHAVSAWERAIEINSSYIKYVTNKKEHFNTIHQFEHKIKKYDSTYKAPHIDVSGHEHNSKIRKIMDLFTFRSKRKK